MSSSRKLVELRTTSEKKFRSPSSPNPSFIVNNRTKSFKKYSLIKIVTSLAHITNQKDLAMYMIWLVVYTTRKDEKVQDYLLKI